VGEAAVELVERLRQAGFKAAIVPVGHLEQLKTEIDGLLSRGFLDRTFHTERLTFFESEPPDGLEQPRSIIITAARQPKMRVRFTWRGRTYPAIIPPTYSLATDEQARVAIEAVIKPAGYRMAQSLLPAKALAGHAGLIEYGRNNVTYAGSWGSFFRLKAFYSDLPPAGDPWQGFEVMDECEQCGACIPACPTGAIDPERFLLQAERCVCYLNEGEADFPQWLDPSWHNCLVGCMLCQDVCPANKTHVDWIVEGVDFSEAETAVILEGASGDEVPASLIAKLDSIDMWWGECATIGRNLRVLIIKADRLSA
jgi:epoxyqueuosine reductase